jgi:hypothetical protein
MFYRDAGKAIAATLILVVTVMGVALFAVVILSLLDRFTIDRILSVVGALGAFGWLVGVMIQLLRYLFGSRGNG